MRDGPRLCLNSKSPGFPSSCTGLFAWASGSGEKWEDSRTGESFASDELASAIEKIKKNSDNK